MVTSKKVKPTKAKKVSKTTKATTKKKSTPRESENIGFWITFLAVLYFLFGLLQVVVLIFGEGWIMWDGSAGEIISRTLGVLVWVLMMWVAWWLYTKKTRAWRTATILVCFSLIISLVIVIFFLTFSPLLFIILDGLLLRALWKHKDIYEVDVSEVNW